MPSYKIVSPRNQIEYNDYYYFRWKYLRKPLNQKIGTERDGIESESIHKMIKNKKENIIAVGRIHWVDEVSSQIRYFAVDNAYRRRGIGSYLMKHFEEISYSRKIKFIILNARENAVPFYQKLGYNITEKSNLLYGKIQHYRMQKII